MNLLIRLHRGVVLALLQLVLVTDAAHAQPASRVLGQALAWQVIRTDTMPAISGVVIGPSGEPLRDVMVYIDGPVGTITPGYS
jgi:hypothetical protein